MSDDALTIAASWLRQGRNVAVATVIETWGSAPRATGSHLVVDADGNFQGSVSGGCVEGAVVAEALEVIAGGAPRMLEFGVADETAWRVGLSCGGRIRIFVEKPGSRKDGLRSELLEALNEERRARKAAALVTDLNDGTSRLWLPREEPDSPLGEAVAHALRTGKARGIEVAGHTLFVNPYLPWPRLVIIGAVHISQALAPMARIAGYAVEIIDPRTAFATPERFPGVLLHACWPHDALSGTPLDGHTALAALTHDPKIDDMPLRAALEADCFYVGALGSRKTHGKRVERMVAAGVDSERVVRIRSPIGIDISAAGPSEIAVAILAEIIGAFRTRGLGTTERAA